MSFEVLGELNWLAVVVAALAYFAFGGLWFSTAAFGRQWQRALGWDRDESETPGVEYYIGPLITCFVTTLALAMLAEATGTDTLGEALVLGIVTGVGVAAAVLFVTGYFDPKKPRPMTWFGITTGYHVVGILIVAIVVGLWT
jgi:Protein of unknown function (DUF1761)